MIVDHVRWTANLGKIALSIIVLCYLKIMERVIELVIMQTVCLMDLIALSGSLRAGNDKISRHLKFPVYTRKNAQVVTSLQTSCNKSVHKLSASCVRTACS